MQRIISFVLLFALLVGGVFAQLADSLNMSLVGVWDCPTDDLEGRDASMGMIGDYVFLAVHSQGSGYGGSDTLWVIDVSNPEAPETAMTYCDSAFTDYPAYIRGFSINEEDSLIFIQYGENYFPGGHDYFRILNFSSNPLSISVVSTIDTVTPWIFCLMIDDWIYAGATIHVDTPETPIIVEPVIIDSLPRWPSDGCSERGIENIATSENYKLYACWIYPDEYPEDGPAAVIQLKKTKHPIADVETLWNMGCWRTDYGGDMTGYSVAINESSRIAALGTSQGIYFVSMDSIEAGRYNCEPIAVWESDEPISDLHWHNDFLFAAGWRPFIIDVSDLSGDGPETVAHYGLIDCPNENYYNGDYVFVRSGSGKLYILEPDSSLQISEAFPIIHEDFRLFPNPIMQGSRFYYSGGNIDIYDISGTSHAKNKRKPKYN